MKRSYIPYIFLIPFFLHVAILSIFPLGFGIYMSFTDFNPQLMPINEAHFIGLSNYIRAITADPLFLRSIKNAFIYVCYEPICILIGFFFALVLNTAIKGRSIFRTIFFIPVITSTVAISFVWLWLYDYNFGPINIVLRALGLPGQNWMNSTIPILGFIPLALIAIMIMSTWQYIGLNVIIFLAGLQSIPKEYHEAARISGAGTWSSFKNITVPLLKPTLLFCAITATAGSLQVFTEVYMVTRGAPAQMTYVPTLMIYDQILRWTEYGYGAALSYIFFLFILAVSLVEIRVMRRGGMVYY